MEEGSTQTRPPSDSIYPGKVLLSVGTQYLPGAAGSGGQRPSTFGSGSPPSLPAQAPGFPGSSAGWRAPSRGPGTVRGLGPARPLPSMVDFASELIWVFKHN